MEQVDLQRLYKRVDLEPPTAYEWAQQTVQMIFDEDVRGLEERLAAYVGAADCVALSGPADGVALALRAAGAGEGDAVLCTALESAHVVQGIERVGATPLFADLNPNTYTMDPYCLDYALGKLRRGDKPAPKALVATGLFGMPCNFAELGALCRREGIVLIEDMGDAFGARAGGARAGSLGRYAVASFSRSGAAEDGGAAVFCRNARDREKLRVHRPCAQLVMHPEEYEDGRRAPRPDGARRDRMEAGVVRAQLEEYDEHRKMREQVAQQYARRLKGAVRLQRPTPDALGAWTQLVVALPSAALRDGVLRELHGRGIPCTVPQLAPLAGGGEWNAVMLVSTMALAGRLVSLPIHPYLSGHVVEYICDSLMEAVQAAPSPSIALAP